MYKIKFAIICILIIVPVIYFNLRSFESIFLYLFFQSNFHEYYSWIIIISLIIIILHRTIMYGWNLGESGWHHISPKTPALRCTEKTEDKKGASNLRQ